MAVDTQSSPQTISVSLEGARKSALSFDDTLFWLTRSNAANEHKDSNGKHIGQSRGRDAFAYNPAFS